MVAQQPSAAPGGPPRVSVNPERVAHCRAVVIEVFAMKPKKTPQPNEHYRCKNKPKTRRRYKMSELMADFKPEHRYGGWDVAPPVGKEIW